MKQFTDFNLDAKIQEGVDVAGFTHCTPVQEETFEALFGGHDVTVKSQTGTGKTAAFLIALFQLLLDDRKSTSDMRGKVLVLAPTRELVVQIEEEAQVLGEFLNFTFCAVYGGVGYQKQEQQLADQPDFIIASPGRLLDFVQGRKIDLRSFNYLVIDEADRMFDMGFYPDIQRILKGMRAPTERRTLLFSATLGTKVLNIAWNFMRDPVNIEIEPEHITVEAITQKLYHVSRAEKVSLLMGLIAKHQPESAIFFTNTKRMAEELSFRLRANNFTAEFIMGDLPQKKRLRIIGAVKRKEISFLVATDVAARGLHIDDLAMVFNYDLPEDPENYVHRIGRTARAGNAGLAISLADEQSVYNLTAIEQFIGMQIPTETVSDELLSGDSSRNIRFNSEYQKQNNRSRERSPRARKPSPRSSAPSANSNSRSGTASRRKAKSSARNKNQKLRSSGAVSREKAPSGSMNEEQRLKYYAQKYGEDFVMKKPEPRKPPAEKGSKKRARKVGLGFLKNLFSKK